MYNPDILQLINDICLKEGVTNFTMTKTMQWHVHVSLQGKIYGNSNLSLGDALLNLNNDLKDK